MTGYASGPEKIRQSIRLILQTAPGERRMLPEFGCGIHELLFEPIDANLFGRISARVREALIDWEPRIDLLDVRVETSPDRETHLQIHIDYRLRDNNALQNMVYPFFLQEGLR